MHSTVECHAMIGPSFCFESSQVPKRGTPVHALARPHEMRALLEGSEGPFGRVRGHFGSVGPLGVIRVPLLA